MIDSAKFKVRSDKTMICLRAPLKQSLKKNFEPTIENSNIENNSSKWTERNTIVATFVSLIACKIHRW